MTRSDRLSRLIAAEIAIRSGKTVPTCCKRCHRDHVRSLPPVVVGNTIRLRWRDEAGSRRSGMVPAAIVSLVKAVGLYSAAILVGKLGGGELDVPARVEDAPQWLRQRLGVVTLETLIAALGPGRHPLPAAPEFVSRVLWSGDLEIAAIAKALEQPPRVIRAHLQPVATGSAGRDRSRRYRAEWCDALTLFRQLANWQDAPAEDDEDGAYLTPVSPRPSARGVYHAAPWRAVLPSRPTPAANRKAA